MVTQSGSIGESKNDSLISLTNTEINLLSLTENVKKAAIKTSESARCRSLPIFGVDDYATIHHPHNFGTMVDPEQTIPIENIEHKVLPHPHESCEKDQVQDDRDYQGIVERATRLSDLPRPSFNREDIQRLAKSLLLAVEQPVTFDAKYNGNKQTFAAFQNQDHVSVISLTARKILGQGAFAMVYKVKDFEKNPFVLKVLHFKSPKTELPMNQEEQNYAKNDILSEADILRKLHQMHPNGKIPGVQSAPHCIVDTNHDSPEPLFGFLCEKRVGDGFLLNILLEKLPNTKQGLLQAICVDIASILTVIKSCDGSMNIKAVEDELRDFQQLKKYVKNMDEEVVRRMSEPGFIIENAERLIGAVKFLADQHIVHTDIKMENMLFDENGMLELSDFGGVKTCLERASEPLGPSSSLFLSTSDVDRLHNIAFRIKSCHKRIELVKKLINDGESETKENLRLLVNKASRLQYELKTLNEAFEMLQIKRMVFALGKALQTLSNHYKPNPQFAKLIKEMIQENDLDRISIEDAYAQIAVIKGSWLVEQTQQLVRSPVRR